ncbi:alkaline phosphatase family protein, partial [Frankia casuarinae]|uniref:alkaline phosphatase family protein n=2 Tax=Frankia TaxID=1854 RepID=UPI001F320C42
MLRGGRFRGVHALGDLASHALEALHSHDRVFCYAYHGDLDTLGHIYGPGSEPWRQQLALIDHLAARITTGLPTDSMLVITADHGMVSVTDGDQIDLDTEPMLRDGVRMLGG